MIRIAATRIAVQGLACGSQIAPATAAAAKIASPPSSGVSRSESPRSRGWSIAPIRRARRIVSGVDHDGDPGRDEERVERVELSRRHRTDASIAGPPDRRGAAAPAPTPRRGRRPRRWRAPGRPGRAPARATYGAVAAARRSPSRTRRWRPAIPTGASAVGAAPASTCQAADGGRAVPARLDRRRWPRRPRPAPRRRARRPAAPPTGSGTRGRTGRSPAASARRSATAVGESSETSPICPQPTSWSPLASCCTSPWLGESTDVCGSTYWCAAASPCGARSRAPTSIAARARPPSPRRGLVVEDLDRAVGEQRRVVLPGEAHARRRA